jgi:2,4-dienoyl-CoA reductase-like NADH-dependent reductase (Old Yellow Enzyme family)
MPVSRSKQMLLKSVEKFLRDERLAAATFGRAAVGDPSFVFELRKGREPRPSTAAKVLAYIASRPGLGSPTQETNHARS